MNTIISKRTGTFTYAKWVKKNGQFHQDGPGILINGGAGIVGGAELLSGKPMEKRSLLIPVGVHTYVDDEALEKLMSIGKFRKDMERGIITVVRGKKCDQDTTDKIASKDMLEDDHIPTRPVTRENIEDAGGTINNDGSVNITNVEGDASPLRMRDENAGLPNYQKKANAEARKRDSAERKAASRRRNKRS